MYRKYEWTPTKYKPHPKALRLKFFIEGNIPGSLEYIVNGGNTKVPIVFK